jgi:hypothetical protein
MVTMVVVPRRDDIERRSTIHAARQFVSAWQMQLEVRLIERIRRKAIFRLDVARRPAYIAIAERGVGNEACSSVRRCRR